MFQFKIFLGIIITTLFSVETKIQPSVFIGSQISCEKQFSKELKVYVYSNVTKSPSYPGGAPAWMRFMSKHLVYQKDLTAEESNQTNSIATFVVKKSGELTQFGIKGKIFSEWTSLDTTLISILKKSGRWIPGECEGQKVATYYQQPLTVDFFEH